MGENWLALANPQANIIKLYQITDLPRARDMHDCLLTLERLVIMFALEHYFTARP